MNKQEVDQGGELCQNSEQLTISQFRFERGRILSFNDMRHFFARSFIDSLQALHELSIAVEEIIESEEIFEIDNAKDAGTWLVAKAKIGALVSDAKFSFEHIDLIAATAQAERLAALFDVTNNGFEVPDFNLVKQWLDDLKFWVNHGMEGQAFVHLNPIEMKEFWKGRRLAEELQDKLPEVFYDMEEATKCLALERSTASAMHLMRVIDTTLTVLGAPLNVDTITCPSWHSFLDKLHNALNKHYGTTGPDGWWKHNEFYRDTMPQLHAIKNAWRNPSFHAASKYTEEEAREIFDAVKAFVRRLASNMPITL